jgi:guanine nucleotide-binding protein subunit alpha
MYILGENELNSEESFPPDYLGPIKAIWHDKGVNEVIKKGNEYALHDNLA